MALAVLVGVFSLFEANSRRVTAASASGGGAYLVLSAPEDITYVFAETQEDREHRIFLPVIMYHGVIDNLSAVNDYVITPAMFSSDMEYLAEHGYQTVLVSDIINYLDMGIPLPEKPVLVTFDDGHYNVLKYIYPIMEEQSLRAIINVEGAFMEGTIAEGRHSSEYSYLTWEEVCVLAESGLFEIGNHTYNMHALQGGRKGTLIQKRETSDEYKVALHDDIVHLQSLLWQECNVTPNAFAYPYGLISDESIPVLKDLGFRVLMTCYEKPNYLSISPGETLMLHRYNRSGKVTTEEFMSGLLAAAP